ncbi:uncharacterized protein B0H18DRAFT_870704 [Fomitopsis serialis]|uniref:uncharacterized protein n=1 Tax=Fomitopsis serialis TaxID=139415 RepID=UPI002008D581|nr:uncharacterized protein B0H18DRAFT_870704 [Neoantrodia serialis]KAH9933365.1 hypothetical protein B0H18DRAFT_870704 [Neoantrodia serialis]
MSSLSDASPSSSPSLSPTRSRRLSARRGSVAASDPWGAHNGINNNPSRATSSRLTIVRVPKEDEDSNNQRRHRRVGSNASISSTSSSGKGETGRMSFAFSSFTPASKDGPPRDGSPTASPRARPHSPGSISRRYSGSMAHANKLSPEQLVDVARVSCNPRPAIAPGSGSPVSAGTPSPVSFTPLPDSVFVPFVDRPFEVSQLMCTPPSAKLFALLAQTYPADSRKPHGAESVESLTKDPVEWTYADLEFWLKNVDRDAVDDVQWVMKARACIISKSELIWERIKGALGVPHELDVEEEDLPLIVEPEADTTSIESEGEQSSAVIESPSPSFAVNPASPNLEGDEMILIEPVLAQSHDHPPTSSALDPHTTHELCEVREEDEDDEDAESAVASDTLDPEVHGLRFLTSPASPGTVYPASPAGSPSPMPLGSPAISPMSIPRSHSFHDKDSDTPYDALAERGPGHPLFPSSFAQLSMRPTLGSKPNRAQSLWNPPAPAFGNPHSIRTSLAGGPRSIGGGYRPFMKDWAHAYDPARHEFALASSTGSVSALGD